MERGPLPARKKARSRAALLIRSGVQGNQGAGLQIYGDTMFKAQLVAFNGGNQSLGFGQKPVPK